MSTHEVIKTAVNRAIELYGFAHSDLDDETTEHLKALGKMVLALTPELGILVDEGRVVEISEGVTEVDLGAMYDDGTDNPLAVRNLILLDDMGWDEEANDLREFYGIPEGGYDEG